MLVQALDARPAERIALRRPRLGLYRAWGGNMDEGWTRFVLEQFAFSPATVRNADIRAGQLRDRFDVLIVPDQSMASLLTGLAPSIRPEPYSGGIGPQGVAALHEFVAAGGTLVTLDSASELALVGFGVPVTNALAGLRDSEFSIPGSVLRLEVDVTHPIAWGVPADVNAFFAQGLAFAPAGPHERGQPESWAPASHVVASYSRSGLLQSGWLLGGDRISGRAALVDTRIGAGRVVLVGFRAQHRAQPHATFKFLFNAILAPPPDAATPAAQPAPVRPTQ